MKPPAGKVFRTKKALAAHYRTSATTVANWTNRPDFPGGGKGPWKQAAIDDFLHLIRSPQAPAGGRTIAGTSHAHAGGGPAGEALAKQKLQADVINSLEAARGKKLKNDQFEGRHWDKDLVVRTWSAFCIRVKERLQAIPAELCVELPPEVRDPIRERWEQQIDLILREMAAWSLTDDA